MTLPPANKGEIEPLIEAQPIAAIEPAPGSAQMPPPPDKDPATTTRMPDGGYPLGVLPPDNDPATSMTDRLQILRTKTDAVAAAHRAASDAVSAALQAASASVTAGYRAVTEAHANAQRAMASIRPRDDHSSPNGNEPTT